MTNAKDNQDNGNDYEAWAPHVNAEELAKAAKEQAKLHSSIGILADFFRDIDADIEAHRGLDMIAGVNVSTDPDDLKLAVLVNNEVRAKLVALRDKYRVQYSQFVQEEPDQP